MNFFFTLHAALHVILCSQNLRMCIKKIRIQESTPDTFLKQNKNRAWIKFIVESRTYIMDRSDVMDGRMMMNWKGGEKMFFNCQRIQDFSCCFKFYCSIMRLCYLHWVKRIEEELPKNWERKFFVENFIHQNLIKWRSENKIMIFHSPSLLFVDKHVSVVGIRQV